MKAHRKIDLRDLTIKGFKPAEPGKRYVVWDGEQPNLCLRITDKGRKSFVVVRQRAGDSKIIWHTLGQFPTLSLKQAREAARAALGEIGEGKHPREVKEERLRAETLRRQDTVAVVTEEFIKRHVAPLRSAQLYENTLRHEVLGQKMVDGAWIADPDHKTSWRDRPITSITRRDVIELVERVVDRGARWQARTVFAVTRTLFNWAVARSVYGLEHSPFDRLRPKDIFGKFKSRKRVLSDEEICLVWRATDQLGYPFGTLTRMLLITGQRLNEPARARWREFDLDEKLWSIPPERMKRDSAHEVPLSPLALDLLKSVTRIGSDAFVFTTPGGHYDRKGKRIAAGKTPISGFSKAKRALDEKIAALCKEAAAGAEVEAWPRWTYHDLRRTVRTRLAELRVPDLICELVIAHRQPELHETYDQHKYRAEKTEALAAWSARLTSIVTPPPDDAEQPAASNVVSFAGARS